MYLVSVCILACVCSESCILADEMGLGKTIQTVGFLSQIQVRLFFVLDRLGPASVEMTFLTDCRSAKSA